AGLLGPIGVGWGKTGIAELAGELVSRIEGRRLRTVALVPPELREKTIRDRSWWSEHYDYDPPLLVSHAKLSVPAASLYLEELRPDVIVIDEAHAFRHMKSARTKRLVRYAVEHPETRFIILSGTL